jgi:hypothetical protein
MEKAERYLYLPPPPSPIEDTGSWYSNSRILESEIHFFGDRRPTVTQIQMLNGTLPTLESLIMASGTKL